MSRMVVCLVAASVLSAWASAACNPTVATELDSGDCSCNDSSLVYDYRENVCEDESVLYCSAGYGPFGNSTGCYTGFTNTTEQCDDVDECDLDTLSCPASKVCYNTPGQYHCGCGDKFYSTGGSCINIDESLNPLWNNCPQLVSDRAPGYICRCFNKIMFNDTRSDGMSCELNPGYTDCSKVSDKGVMCVEESATSQQTFFPMPGFQLNVNNASEDKDECLNLEKTLCWDNADCQNRVDVVGYNCTCRPGYTDNIFPGVVKECILKKCNKGEGLDCVHACDDYTESQQDKYCVLQNDLPTYTSRFADVICDKPSSSSQKLFKNTIVIFDPEESPGLVTQSLEMVFGAGNVQLLPNDPGSPNFTLHVLLNMTQEGAKARLDSHCVGLSQLPGYCELPGCVIIEQVITDFILDEAMCAECPQDTHDYDFDTRTCKCKDGGTQTYFEDILELCEYQCGSSAGSQTTTTIIASSTKQVSQITTVEASSTEQVSQITTAKASSTEQVSQITTAKASSTEQVSSTIEETNWRDVATDLQQQLDDAEDALTITAAVLGTLLGLSLVGIVVLVFFKKGQFFSS